MDASQSQTEKPQWKINTIAKARQHREPTEYIIDRFLATYTLNAVYGAPGSLKSMCVLDMALHVATGKIWMPGAGDNRKGFVTQKRPVLWVDADNGQRRTDERIDAMSKKIGVLDDDPFYYISMPNPPLIAGDLESMDILMTAALELECGMIIIDNLGLVTGDVEENSAHMAQVMRNFRHIAEGTGAAIVMIHHQRKGGANGSRAGDALRGHSSIEASLDLALQVVREQNSQEIMIQSTKTRGVDVPSVTAEFWYRHIDGTRDLEDAWFTAVTPITGNNPVKIAILQTVKAHKRITKGKLIQLVYEDFKGKESIGKIRAWFDDMVAITEELIVTDGPRNAKIITLGDVENVPV